MKRVLTTAFIAAALACAGIVHAAEFRVGNIASTSNPTSKANATNLATGYQVYFDHVNKQGGVNGHTLRLVQLDDEVNAKKMLELTAKLIDDPRTIALAGFLNSPGLGELARENIAAKRGIALIAPISGLVSTSPNWFPLRATYFDEMNAIVDNARSSGKKRLALVWYNQAFGPTMFKHAQATAQRAGIEVVATASFETAPDKMSAGIAEAAESIAKATPDAVIVIAAGAGATEFVRRFRATSAKTAQLYTLSPVDALTLVKNAGLDAAKGVIISQGIPYPDGRSLRIVREYQDLMRKYAPDQPFTYFGLEGFMGAKIVVEAMRRSGNEPTRARLVASLRAMKNFDLGDFEVNYADMERWRRSPFVELSIIGSSGKLFR